MNLFLNLLSEGAEPSVIDRLLSYAGDAEKSVAQQQISDPDYWGSVGIITLTGILVVFLILAILIFFFWLLGTLFKAVDKSKKKKQVNRDSAFGVFVGYSLGLDKSKYTAQEYRDMIEKKMDADILYYAPQIRDRINKMGLQNRSFYIYVLPLDDAEEDKKSIMKKIMREGDA